MHESNVVLIHVSTPHFAKITDRCIFGQVEPVLTEGVCRTWARLPRETRTGPTSVERPTKTLHRRTSNEHATNRRTTVEGRRARYQSVVFTKAGKYEYLIIYIYIY